MLDVVLMQGDIEGELVTPERLAKGDVDRRSAKRAYIRWQVPLDFYYRRRRPLITTPQYDSGSRLHEDFYLSGQSPGVTITLTEIRSSNSSFTETQLEARDRWREAMKAIQGEVAQQMVLNVCCYGHLLSHATYNYYRNPEHAMSRFREALGDLAKYYGFIR